MSSQLAQLQEATIKQHCKTLRMPMMASQFSTLAEQAVREKKTHTGYLEVLLTAEIKERERNTIRHSDQCTVSFRQGCVKGDIGAGIRIIGAGMDGSCA
jgi:hypothetical protein